MNKERLKRQKLIELAERKRGILKKRDPLQLKIRAFQGALVSDQSRMENQSIALHWKNWGIGQNQLNYHTEGQYGKNTNPRPITMICFTRLEGILILPLESL